MHYDMNNYENMNIKITKAAWPLFCFTNSLGGTMVWSVFAPNTNWHKGVGGVCSKTGYPIFNNALKRPLGFVLKAFFIAQT